MIKTNDYNKVDKTSSKSSILEIFIKNLAKYKKIKNLAKLKIINFSFLNFNTRLGST